MALQQVKAPRPTKGRVIRLDFASRKKNVSVAVTATQDVDSIKKSFELIIEIGTAIVALVKDFSLAKAAALIFELADFKTFLPIFKEALNEFKEGITPAESKEISDHIKDKFDIPNDELEERIEKIITLIPNTYDYLKSTFVTGAELYGDWKEAFKGLKTDKIEA